MDLYRVCLCDLCMVVPCVFWVFVFVPCVFLVCIVLLCGHACVGTDIHIAPSHPHTLTPPHPHTPTPSHPHHHPQYRLPYPTGYAYGIMVNGLYQNKGIDCCVEDTVYV